MPCQATCQGKDTVLGLSCEDDCFCIFATFSSKAFLASNCPCLLFRFCSSAAVSASCASVLCMRACTRHSEIPLPRVELLMATLSASPLLSVMEQKGFAPCAVPARVSATHGLYGACAQRQSGFGLTPVRLALPFHLIAEPVHA